MKSPSLTVKAHPLAGMGLAATLFGAVNGALHGYSPPQAGPLSK